MRPSGQASVMCVYHLRLHQWAAFSVQRKEPEQWVDWALGQDSASGGPYKPELPDVPAMLRRRLSAMGKAALWCAGQVLSEQPEKPPVTSVFCSQHGEVGRTVSLLRDLAEYAPLSPAAFSLSVHNAIGGIHSIARGVHQPVSAISAGPDTAFSALLEAWSQLRFRTMSADSRAQSDGGMTAAADDLALCVIYDDPLPDEVADPEDPSAEVQAMALLVSCPDPRQPVPDTASAARGALDISFELADSPTHTAAASSARDDLLRFLLDPSRTAMDYPADGRRWTVRKPGCHPGHCGD